MFGSILWLRWKSCVACGWSLVLLCGSRICSSSLLQSCFFKWLYQRFLTSLCVRPGRWAAILCYTFPSCNITQTDQTIISYDYGKVWGWFSLPIPIERLEADDGVVFLLGEVPSLDIRIQIVILPLPTTLATPAQPCQLCDIWIGISALTFKDPLVFFFGGPSRCLLLWSYHHGFPCKDGRN